MKIILPKLINPESVVLNYNILTDCSKCGHKEIHHLPRPNDDGMKFGCLYCICIKKDVKEELGMRK